MIFLRTRKEGETGELNSLEHRTVGGARGGPPLWRPGGPTSLFVLLFWGRWRRLRLYPRIGSSVTVVREK